MFMTLYFLVLEADQQYVQNSYSTIFLCSFVSYSTFYKNKLSLKYEQNQDNLQIKHNDQNERQTGQYTEQDKQLTEQYKEISSFSPQPSPIKMDD